MSIQLFYIFVSSLFCTVLIMPSLFGIAEHVGGIDRPDQQRKLHTVPVPRIGGIAIFGGSTLSILIFMHDAHPVYGLLAGGAVIFSIGLLDDIKQLSPRRKLCGQIFGVGLASLVGGISLDNLGSILAPGMTLNLGWLAVPFTVFAVVGLINAINMMDGLDGLATGVSSIAFFTFAVMAMEVGKTDVLWISLALAGATSGFLAFNSHPARIFMGDCGSNMLGFFLGYLAVMLVGEHPGGRVSPVAPLVVLALPVLDALVVMGRRFLLKSSILQADRNHIHYRLFDMGIGHRAAVVIIYGCSLVMAWAGLSLRGVPDHLLFYGLLVASGIFFVVIVKLAGFYGPLLGRLDSLIARRRNVPLYQLVAVYSEKLIGLSKYLVIAILLLPVFSSDYNFNLGKAVVAFILLAGMATGYVLTLKAGWNSQLLQMMLYLSVAYLTFLTENYSRSDTLAGTPVLALSFALFLALLVVIALKIFVKRRIDLLVNSGVEYLILFQVIFIPFLPDSITSIYHLLTVNGKALLLFIAFKLLLNNGSNGNRSVLHATMIALLISLLKIVVS
jgi:UDP-GlcNAc:undecaprenyl-phosphate GlcNAc-1-phosphate transferase